MDAGEEVSGGLVIAGRNGSVLLELAIEVLHEVARLELALAPSFLRAICSIPSFGIAKFAVNIWSIDTNKNTNKTDGCGELLHLFSTSCENFLEHLKSN